MEVIDLLRLARRWVWLVVLAPVLAVGAVVAVALSGPASTTVTATVRAPGVLGTPASQFTGPQAAARYAASFQSAASGPAVGARVAESTGVAPDALADGLEVSQDGASATMVVSFSATEADVVEPVVEAVAAETLQEVFGARAEVAQSGVESAREDVGAAGAALDDFAAAHEVADPDRAYEAQLAQVNTLVAQQAALRASGDLVAAGTLGVPLEAARSALGSYTPLLATFESLRAEQAAAVARLSSAQAELAAAESEVASADPDSLLFTDGPRSAGRLVPLLRVAAPVAAAALFLSLVVAGLAELLLRRRRPQGRGLGEQAVGAEDEPSAQGSWTDAAGVARTTS